MKRLRLLSIALLLTIAANTAFTQKDSMSTEVFTMSTCEPNNSLNNAGKPNSRYYKLETKTSQASVFKITGINPLRFKYYINNQAVTQFMESSPLTLSLGTFTAGSYVATAPVITVPEIFKTESVVSTVKASIKKYQDKGSEFEDSITKINLELDEIWFGVQAKFKESAQIKEYRKLPTVGALERRLNKNKIAYDKNLKAYQIFTGGLAINNPNFGLLQLYKNIDTLDSRGNNDIDSIRKFKCRFAHEYIKCIEDFKRINDLLFALETNGLYEVAHTYNKISTIRELKKQLRNYNFAWTESYTPDTRDSSGREELLRNIRDVKQQILDKQYQIWEEFVINTATRIGVFIQNQFRVFSGFNNALEHYACLDSLGLDSIVKQRGRLDTTFMFIQQTNAELQTLVPYLDINTELYQSIAKRINDNYVFLLSYMKNLDYASKANSIQYTLPTHNNLKNIDLIRYTVKRTDKITDNTQEYNYDLWLKGGLKIDFSFGFFGTRLTDNVYSKVLLDTAGGIDEIRITRQDDGRADFAFGGMVNITHRNGAKWLNVGGSVGVAYSANKSLQVLTGLSLHLGKTERLILHGGVGFGTIKYIDIAANNFLFFDRDMKSYDREKLDEIKERDRVYMLKSQDIKFNSYTVPTINKFVIRPFFGISYNLSKKNALQAVAGSGVTTFSDNYKNAFAP